MLDVRTCSEKGSNDEMRVLFSEVGKQNAGGFLVKFEDTMKYQSMDCSGEWIEITSKNCNEKSARTWKFENTAENELKVKCNGEPITNVKTCPGGTMTNNIWTWDISFFSIDGINDQASVSYEIRE